MSFHTAWVVSHSLGQNPNPSLAARTSALASYGHACHIGLGR